MNCDELQREITLHQRRLQKLKERRAMQGISTDPAIEIEIEEIEATIASLRATPPDPPPTPTTENPALTPHQQQRLADLQRHLEQDYELLKAYEDELRLEDDPRRQRRYGREIKRQKAAIADYKRQLAEIVPDAAARPEAIPEPIQETLAALQTQLAAMEARLLTGQQGLSEQLRRQERTLLAHIDARHRQTLQSITTRLEDDQLETVELLYDLVDQQRLGQWELDEINKLVQQSLAELKGLPNAPDWQQLLAAVGATQAVDQKLKLMLPVVPLLLEYELELRADTLPALRQVWQRLRQKIGR